MGGFCKYSRARPRQNRTSIPAEASIYPRNSPPRASLTVETKDKRNGKTKASMANTAGAVRSKNFQVLEDVDLMKCWLSVTTDGSVGANQSGDQFWTRIWELMQAMDHSTRSRDSMQSRFKNVLNKESSKFGGYFIQVSSSPPTGTTFEDWVRLASALYNGIVSSSACDDCGPVFKHLEAWKVVKDHPKYSGGRASGWTERALTPFEQANVFHDVSYVRQAVDASVSNVAPDGLFEVAGAKASTNSKGDVGSGSDPSSNEPKYRTRGNKATRAQRSADERAQKKVRTLDALRSTLDARNSLKRVQLCMLLAADPDTDAITRAQLREEVIKALK
jgi:hypothetical protein